MPGVDNPSGISASIPGQIKDLYRKYKDLSSNRTFSPAGFHIGLTGLVVDGPTTLTGILTLAATINGDVSASGAGIFSGNVSAGGFSTSGSISATGNAAFGGAVSGGNGTFGGQVYSASAFKSPGSRSYVVSTSYAGTWTDGDGTIGISPSSRRFKENIVPADLVELATKLRALVPVWFTYKTAMFDAQNAEKAVIEAAIAAAAAESKIDDASLVDVVPVSVVPLPVVVPPTPVVAVQQLGFIAEDMEAAGLGVLCFYDAAGLVEGINYDRLSIVLAAAAILDHQEILGLQERVLSLEGRLDKAGL